MLRGGQPLSYPFSDNSFIDNLSENHCMARHVYFRRANQRSKVQGSQDLNVNDGPIPPPLGTAMSHSFLLRSHIVQYPSLDTLTTFALVAV